jgi:hypothetical protein
MERNEVAVTRGDDRVAPIFRLLGEELLTPSEVDALTAALLADRLPPVPPARLARACQIARRVGARMVRRFLATLVLERRPWLAVAGVRGNGPGICRLLFAVDEYEVVIQDTSRRYQRGHDLTGQVLRDGEPVPSAAVVLAGRGRPAETEADDEGSFRFGSVAEGSYDLEIWADDDLIVCTPVVLSGAPGEL